MHSHAKPKPKSPGWAALRVNPHPPSPPDHPYPPLPTTLPAYPTLPTNHDFPSRPFSSLLLPPAEGNTIADQSAQLPLPAPSQLLHQTNHALALYQLKQLHAWADDTLIEDVFTTSDNDIDKASTFLRGMLSTSNSQLEEDTRCHSTNPHVHSDRRSVFSGKTTDLGADIAALTSTLEDALTDNDKEFRDMDSSSGNNGAADMKQVLGHLSSIPVEPEWEEDDVYLSHRKHALRMMRSASQHSRAATKAFMRGDHFAAQQHSLKAQEEWSAAEQLNTKAAKEIFHIRNSKNDKWKLDLHGLHAAEAVQVLQQHLLKIETQVPLNRPASPDRVKIENGVPSSSSCDPFSTKNGQKLDKHQTTTFSQRPTSLQVITGVGNHSRGEAALPTAVRSFLSENGYRYDESRPGMITVRPKFRH